MLCFLPQFILPEAYGLGHLLVLVLFGWGVGKWSAVAELPDQPQIQVTGQSFQDKSAQGPQRESQASQILSPDLRARLTKDKRCLTQILSCLRILSGSLQLILY